MSMPDNLITALKFKLKSNNITYADAAKVLDLSVGSVKRLFSEKNFTLQRLDTLCQLADTDLSELMEISEKNSEKVHVLSIEQERKIVENPKLLLVGVCLINRYSFKDILNKYRIEEPELVGIFVKLDMLNLIELLPNNRYRLKLSPDFKWQNNGPIQRFFFESIVSEYMMSELKEAGNNMHFVWGMLTKESTIELSQKIRKLIEEYVNLTSSESKLPHRQKLTSSLFILFKEDWEPSVFKAHWQDKHGLK